MRVIRRLLPFGLIVAMLITFGVPAYARSTAPVEARSPAAQQAAAGSTTVYLPNITRMLGGPDGWQTPFIVQNVGTVATDLQMSFYAFADGSLVKTRTVAALMPGTSVFHDPNSDTGLTAGGQFSVVITSSASPIVAVVNEHQNVTSPTRQEALSYNGLSGGSNVMFLPYVAKNVSGWLTTIIIQNLGTASASVQARFVPASGAPVVLTRTIDAGRSQFIDPTVEAQLVAGTEYGATLTSTQPIGVVVNAHNDAATVPAPRGFSYNAIAATSEEVTYLPYVARHSDAIDRTTRVLILNGGAAAATPKLFLRRHGDTSFTAQVTGPSIAPGAVFSWDAGTAAELTTDGDWSLEATGGKFAVVGATLSPATAMGASASSAFAPTLYLPNVTRTLGGPNGWTTPLIVQSTGAPFVTIKWYRFADGQLVNTQTIADLLPLESVRVDPRSIAQLADNTQYAVVIDSATGGVAATVLETNLGGGDAAMSYDGFSAPPSQPYGTSTCDPVTVVAGVYSQCMFYGLTPGAVPTLQEAIAGQAPTAITNTEATGADGSFSLRIRRLNVGQYTIGVTAGGVTRNAQFFVTAATFAVTIKSSTYGTVSVTTTAGVLCRPLVVFPTGSTTGAFYLSQKTADATGTLSWTYTQPAGTKSGQGTNSVQCFVGAEEHIASGTFTVP